MNNNMLLQLTLKKNFGFNGLFCQKNDHSCPQMLSNRKKSIYKTDDFYCRFEISDIKVSQPGCNIAEQTSLDCSKNGNQLFV
jgi:hypothetical protein